MKKIFKFLLSRLVVNSLLILGQAFLFYILIHALSQYFIIVYAFIFVLGIIISLIIINDDIHDSSFKIPWLWILMILPIFGVILYILNGRIGIKKKIKNHKYLSLDYPCNNENLSIIDNPLLLQEAKYICNIGHISSYNDTDVKYYESGEVMYQDMIKDLERANKYIFLEYFIISEGIMWNSILDILVKKVNEGIDVRVMYDDIGCISTLPNNYYKKLNELGIKCIVFNPFIPVLSMIHNNRDHRKVMIIDGKIGYTGGINLADEYINRYKKYGYWKDGGIKLNGSAVNNLTMMFLDLWNLQCPTDTIYDSFLIESRDSNNSIVIPYCDSPLNNDALGENVYINMINSATKYIYISTPYFIVPSELLHALTNASKRGVDVKIITPAVPDKWLVHAITESYYPTLIESGIEVYEYVPGFIHSKMIICDDVTSVSGTINFDYRSFAHHYENGVWIYNNKVIKDMKQDYIDTMFECKKIGIKEYQGIKWYKRLCGKLLKIFAPLM